MLILVLGGAGGGEGQFLSYSNKSVLARVRMGGKISEVAEQVWPTDCQVKTGELLLLPMPRGLKPAHSITHDSLEYQISNMSRTSGTQVA